LKRVAVDPSGEAVRNGDPKEDFVLPPIRVDEFNAE
jgi:hypothetical protein